MSTAARDVGLVWTMIVHSIVTGVLHILAKKQKGHHLYVIHAAKRIRKHVSITSTIILQKKQTEIKCNKFNYRQGRTYEDFQKYMEEHPDTAVVEMDTVRGLRTKEQVLLTIMFNNNSVMLMILIEEEAMDPVIEVFDKLTKV